MSPIFPLLTVAFSHLAQAWPSPQDGAAQTPLLPQEHSQGYVFDPLLHLPGISP